MLIIQLIRQEMLTIKIASSVKEQWLTFLETEKKLMEAEIKIYRDPEGHQDKVVAFIADDLTFANEAGVQLFKVTVYPVQAFVIIRCS